MNELVGYVRKSRNGNALKLSLSVECIESLRVISNDRGQDYIPLEMNGDKLREIIAQTREVTAINASDSDEFVEELSKELPEEDTEEDMEEPDEGPPGPPEGPPVPEELLELDTMYTWFQRADVIRAACDKRTQELFTLKYDYHSPFNNYTFTNGVEEIHKDCIRFAVKLLRELYPNVPVDPDEVVRHFWDGNIDFSVKTVHEYLQVTYFAFARVLSNKEIYRKARQLLPWSSVKGEETQLAKANAFTRKKRLVLSKWAGEYPSFSEVGTAMEALDQMAMIIHGDCDPVTVHSSLWESNKRPEKDELWERTDVSNSLIKSFKWHKNGNLYVWFETEDIAKAVAMALAGEKAPIIGNGTESESIITVHGDSEPSGA